MKELFSQKLGETIAILDEGDPPHESLPSYKRDEFRFLYDMPKESLARINEIKKVFGGEIKRKIK